LLHNGALAAYLDGIGRSDLGRTAREAQGQGDPDAGLYSFVHDLPATGVQGPRLDLAPRRLAIGPIRAGDQRKVRIEVSNQGQGILQGKLRIGEGDQWLVLAEGEGSTTIHAPNSQEIILRADARGLTAGRSYSGKLIVITNGGIAEVPVRLDVAAVPFARPPFQGAASPRELAERIRTNPKPAVPLLESGDVARWFQANGWTYPVPGTPAPGVAAVQQLFEFLGLSKPPPLQLSADELSFTCKSDEVLYGEVVLRTTARKWVYARVESDAPWLRVQTPAVSGPQQVTAAFELDGGSLPLEGPQTGTLQLMANGGQKLSVLVRAEVIRPRRPYFRLLIQSVTVGALLGLVVRLLLALPGDLVARGLAGNGPPATLDGWLRAALADAAFLRAFVLATWWLGGPVGLVLAWRRGGRWADLFCATVAGAASGLPVGVTAGCLLSAIDAVPRAVLIVLPFTAGGWLGTTLWIMAATISWAALGAAAGLVLAALGGPGRWLLALLAAPLAGLFRLCGLERLATLLRLE
jgi:hypothetical protein